MQREVIIQKLKDSGCRITKQRLILLDIILDGNCSSCKEIYYKASKIDGKIGTATVYRMINTLEEIGAINRKNMYKIEYNDEKENTFTIEFEDNTVMELPEQKWKNIVQTGLRVCGYSEGKKVAAVLAK